MDWSGDKFFNKLKEIADRLETIHKELAHKLKMNCGELGIFRLLCRKEQLSATQISELSKIDKPATSRTLNKLVDNGLVDKTYKDNNKKTQYVFLTEKGKELKSHILKQLSTLGEKYFNKLSQQEAATLFDILDKVVAKGEQNA